jgi:hypothetical protein
MQEDPVAEQMELIALCLAGGMRIRPAPAVREWMETPAGQFAKRCLPLLIANRSHGWITRGRRRALVSLLAGWPSW